VRKNVKMQFPRFHKHLKLYDMSGVKNMGSGGAEEIGTLINTNLQKGWIPNMVVIDWFGLMVMRHLSKRGGREDDPRSRMMRASETLSMLRDRYNVMIVALHQISPAELANRTPAFIPDHTVSQDCKALSQLFDYTVVFGKRCPKTQCMYCNFAKVRHGKRLTRIVKMNAEYDRIDDVDDVYEVNQAGGRDNEWFLQSGKAGKI
jgi:hypothetical protein